ncbi:nitroreductase family protein [Pseudohalioglobus lutimaris]|uniref:Nitroreductase family protein n=1 Tax=Pseudohalioglobus lutimaris TaxID=1737061 RepID=A0A2N5X3E2_9GAMM|nr:nitroreductase family protein [Pseudohalioglobus lutimaris]PLW68970.1 nitroreductase family protein [Pseudohalioglobus lutimaris]
MKDYQPVPLPDWKGYDEEEMRLRAANYLSDIRRRHSVRNFSDIPVPRDIIETCIRAAGTAPSGANHQPWHFVCVSDPTVKRKIRIAAEHEEEAFYSGRAGEDWLENLDKLGTDQHKPFLETAPWLIAIFLQRSSQDDAGNKRKNYYTSESVGIATGFLLNALHCAGLATLTHTPNPMRFLNEVLNRPATERAYMLLVVGHPTDDATVPAAALQKKPLPDIATFI